MKNQPRNRSDAARRRKSVTRQKNNDFQPLPEGQVWLWGVHAGQAAVENAQRRILSGYVTRNAAIKIDLDPDNLPERFSLCDPAEIDQRLPSGAVHQGVALIATELPGEDLGDIAARGEGPVVILDQVTDPQNVGAIMRSAAAFGVKAVIMQTRKSPPLMGALAKAAAGAVETIPDIRVVNIARAIDTLRGANWHVVGLAGETETELKSAFDTSAPLAIVLGAEGPGLRPAVAKACDELARIPIHSQMESLNVSNAAAIAFYEAAKN